MSSPSPNERHCFRGDARGSRAAAHTNLSTCSGPSRPHPLGLWRAPRDQQLLRWALPHLQWLLLKRKKNKMPTIKTRQTMKDSWLLLQRITKHGRQRLSLFSSQWPERLAALRPRRGPGRQWGLSLQAHWCTTVF